MDSNNGWIKSDTIIIEADISAMSCNNAKRLMITPRELQDFQRAKNLQNRMQNLLTTGFASDVHFLVGKEKESISAQKLILLSASDVYQTMFNKTWDGTRPIEVPDVTAAAFKIMLQHIYTEEDPQGLEWRNLFDVLNAAKKYNLEALENSCFARLHSLELDNENVLFVLSRAPFFDAQDSFNKELKMLGMEGQYEMKFPTEKRA